jgi:hypothetical protein
LSRTRQNHLDQGGTVVRTPGERLLELYPEAVVRAGRVYPAAIARPDQASDQASDQYWGRLLIDDAPPALDPGLLGLGAAHLAGRVADDRLTNGPTACWLGDGPDGVRVTRGRYLDMIATCDALRAEFQAGAELPLRARAHQVAGDPLASGAGRSAAIGVSVILTVPAGVPGLSGDRRAFVIGRRGQVSADRDRWHVAPSGMLELNDVPDPIADTVATELAEELGIRIDRARIGERMLVLGLVHDLLRLKPDLVVRLDLAAAEVPAELAAASEFSQLALVGTDRDALAGFWAAHDPQLLTPAAAGAVAVLESGLPA